MSSQSAAVSHPPGDPILLRFQELEEKVRQSRALEDPSILHPAFEFAAAHHGSQRRKSGEPFLVHPLEVAHLLADMRLDLVCVATGLLHDVVEDTGVGIEEIRERFGPEIAGCVDGVTKLGRLGYHSAEDRQAETFRKMLLAMVADIRVILVKLADRLHNMRTLGYLDAEKQQQVSRETLEIYAPIALRLGMGKVRGELEDLAFQYLEPEAYQEIAKKLESRRESRHDFLAQVKQLVGEKLGQAGIPAQIEGRVKRAYSIYQKLKRQKITVEQVYDLLALRVITDSVQNCYGALGVIHNQWRPVPGRIKDFIAMPRPNLYQSLHTSVITDQGQKVELQIRTEEMHHMAEEGICAHWKYKEGHVGAAVDDRRMAWLRQLVDWQQDVNDPSDFLSTLKVDLYPEEVYVFTPKGKLIALPQGATPVDFAYTIHTEVGHQCVGAKANGRIVPLKHRLRNGDIIEIITKAGHPPSRDWLAFVKSSRARSKIRQWLNTHRRKKAEEIGQKLLEKEARRLRLSLTKVSKEAIEKVCRDYGCAQLSDLLAALGYGRYSARQIVAKLLPEAEKAVPEAAAPDAGPTADKGRSADSPANGVLTVEGIDDVLVYRARCCNPIGGEPIVGYVTRGKGVAGHSKDCPNVRNLMYEPERRMDVQWARSSNLTYQTRLNVYVDDRPGVLNDLTNIVSDEKINIASLETHATDPSQEAVIEMTLEISNVNQLQRVMAAMKKVEAVREVSRSNRV